MASLTGNVKQYKGNKKAGEHELQHCINESNVKEVLKLLPKDIEIIGAKVEIGGMPHTHFAVVSNKMRLLGVERIKSYDKNLAAFLVFDKVKPKALLANILAVAREIGTDPDKAYFRYLTLQYKDVAGKFDRTKKSINLDEDRRKKLTVLGLTEGKGRVSQLLARIGTTAYRCDIQTVETKIVLCSKA
jgi:hypothetical protein